MAKYTVPGFRLGCVSYLLPVDYVAGFRFAASLCADVTLLLFESGKDGACPLSPDDIGEIGRIGAGEGSSVTVHLPADADFATDAGARKLVDGALAAVERTAPLDPQAYVLHLPMPGASAALLGQALHQAFTERVRDALLRISAALPQPERLALENLEGQPHSFLESWLNGSPWSRCFDVGHVWKDALEAESAKAESRSETRSETGSETGSEPGSEPESEVLLPEALLPEALLPEALLPEALLPTWLPRTRLFHLHGVRLSPRPNKGPGQCMGQDPRQHLRDHSSLRFLPEPRLDAFCHRLWASAFTGLVTLEVFSPHDLETSWQALLESYARYEQKRETLSPSCPSPS